MAQHFTPATENVVKNYTLTAILSFAFVFCLFTLMSTIKGDFNPPVSHHTTDAKHESGSNSNHPAEHKIEHKAGH